MRGKKKKILDPKQEKEAEIVFLSTAKNTLTDFQDNPKNAQLAERIYPEVLLESLRAVISTLEEKDSYTHGHSLRTAEYSVMIGEELGIDPINLRELELCALFHDIGKIGIPDSILLKPAKLTSAEFEIMKSHPVRSAKILEKISALKNLIPGIRYHHERYDGLGYPEGLKGEAIPLYARILLIADTFDAMTSTRPYRLALHKEIAFAELRKFAGTQFDPILVDTLIRRMSKPERHRLYHTGMTKKIA